MRYAVIQDGVVQAITEAVGGPPFVHAEGREAIEIGSVEGIEEGMPEAEVRKRLQPHAEEVAARSASEKAIDPALEKQAPGVVEAKNLVPGPTADDQNPGQAANRDDLAKFDHDDNGKPGGSKRRSTDNKPRESRPR